MDPPSIPEYVNSIKHVVTLKTLRQTKNKEATFLSDNAHVSITSYDNNHQANSNNNYVGHVPSDQIDSLVRRKRAGT